LPCCFPFGFCNVGVKAAQSVGGMALDPPQTDARVLL
jgi:hypothetical protein